MSSTPRTQLSQVEPSANRILSALSPADADVFRSALDGIPLICRTPPAFMNLPLLPTYTETDDSDSSSKIWALHILEEPVPFYSVFARMPGFFCGPGCIDDQLFAARAALRFTAEELDAQIEACVSTGRAASHETFQALISYRLACVIALMPLNLKMASVHLPLTMSQYAWTWRTCMTCARHDGHALENACGPRCTDAPWFLELWRQLVTILRARPDPESVLMRGLQHRSQALRTAMACPTCAKVAHEHLRCFHGLLVVEAAKRITEVGVLRFWRLPII